MGWEGKARWKEEPETKTGKQIRGALTIRLSNRHGRADIILFRFIAPKGPQPHDHRLRRHPIKPWHAVRRSKLHGNGVFAARKIPAGTRIIEYGGQRISAKEADRRHPTNPDDPFHTFFFALSSGRVIDGGDEGNDARWINHSCEPNCEAQEGKHGKRVYIVAVRDIARGEELSYDYGLVLDGRITALRDGYRCLCGTPPCRGTMLALSDKQKKKAQKKLAEARQAEAQPVAKSADAPTKKRGGSKQAVKPGAKQDALLDAKPDAKPAAKQDAPAQANGQAATAGAETRPQAGRSHCPAGSSPVQGPAAKRRATHKTAPVPSPPETPPAAGVLPRPAPAGVQSAGR